MYPAIIRRYPGAFPAGLLLKEWSEKHFLEDFSLKEYYFGSKISLRSLAAFGTTKIERLILAKQANNMILKEKAGLGSILSQQEKKWHSFFFFRNVFPKNIPSNPSKKTDVSWFNYVINI